MGAVAVCLGCGLVSACDDDRCCLTCGRDLIVVADAGSADVLTDAIAEALAEGEAAGAARERAAAVAWLREKANAEHPIERGVPSLSPVGRGLLLFHADRIERGAHIGAAGGAR